jgi:hypothetical protein
VTPLLPVNDELADVDHLKSLHRRKKISEQKSSTELNFDEAGQSYETFFVRKNKKLSKRWLTQLGSGLICKH